jgi:hypothetical protein
MLDDISKSKQAFTGRITRKGMLDCFNLLSPSKFEVVVE